MEGHEHPSVHLCARIDTTDIHATVDNDFVAGDIFKVSFLRIRVYCRLSSSLLLNSQAGLELSPCQTVVSRAKVIGCPHPCYQVFSSILSEDGPGVDSLRDEVDDFHYLGALD